MSQTSTVYKKSLLSILEECHQDCQQQCVLLDAHEKIPNLSKHDHQSQWQTIVDEKNWAAWNKSVQKDLKPLVEIDTWQEEVRFKVDVEVNDVTIYAESMFYSHSSLTRKYTVWTFKARVGFFYDAGDEGKLQLLKALLKENLYLCAKNTVANSMGDTPLSGQ
jgi:hypothetical protein